MHVRSLTPLRIVNRERGVEGPDVNPLGVDLRINRREMILVRFSGDSRHHKELQAFLGRGGATPSPRGAETSIMQTPSNVESQFSSFFRSRTWRSLPRLKNANARIKWMPKGRQNAKIVRARQTIPVMSSVCHSRPAVRLAELPAFLQSLQ